jgi:hypothetical protein
MILKKTYSLQTKFVKKHNEMEILNTTDSHNVHVFCDTTNSREIGFMIKPQSLKIITLNYLGTRRASTEVEGQAARELRCQWDKGKYGVSKGRFPQAKEFLRKLSAIWVIALKKFASPVLGPKEFQACRSARTPKTVTLPRAPTYLTPALDMSY